jgi:hypothetical protein
MRFRLSRTVIRDVIMEGYGGSETDPPWDQALRVKLSFAARQSTAHALTFDCPLDCAVAIERYVCSLAMSRHSHPRYLRARASIRKQIKRWSNHPAYRGQGMAEIHADYLSGWMEPSGRVIPTMAEASDEAIPVRLMPMPQRHRTMQITLWEIEAATDWDESIWVSAGV